MSYRIIVDSCCDLTPEKKADPHFVSIPLTIELDGKTYVDDETFNQKEFLAAVAASDGCAKTACPSPEAYRDACVCDAEHIFAVTISQHLSGSYNSAVLGTNLYLEENPDSGKQIHVFSSDSACCGEALVAFKIQELCEKALPFEEIVEQVQDFLDHMKTYFVLEDMETLRKNGRLSGLAALVVSALNIKPVMSANHGVIIRLGQTRGLDRALKSMVDHVIREVKEPEKKILGIVHVNCPERAEKVKRMLCEKARFLSVYVAEAGGLSTTYANDGGIVVSV
ncbi:MAG: DegV family protein [Lachnospiraceae bacterium]|nr:DegV family protein [Lachnospiraceae bacterium]